MRPENTIKEDLARIVDGKFELTPQEQNLLTMFRDLSESDRRYILRAAESIFLVKKNQSNEC